MTTFKTGDRVITLVALGAVSKGTEGTIDRNEDDHELLAITFDTGHHMSSIPSHKLAFSDPTKDT